MKEDQVMQLMAEVGPNAKEALDSWVALQWAEFVMGYVSGLGLFALSIAAILWFAKKMREDYR